MPVDEVIVHGKRFVRTIDAHLIHERVMQLAEKLGCQIKEEDPLFLVVLRGAFVFAADLLRRIDSDPDVEFVNMSSYDGFRSTGVVNVDFLPSAELIKSRSIVIIEDIVESGLTLNKLKGLLIDAGAANVRIVTLFFKPASLKCELQPDFVGFEIPDDFIIGYGLDYDGKGRSLESVYTLSSGT